MGTVTSAPRSLAENLRSRSDDDLRALLRARPDLVTPVPGDMTALAARATTRPSVARAIDRLDRFTLLSVEALALMPEPGSLTSLRTLLGVPADDARGAVTTLREQALVWGTDDALYLVRAVHDVLGPFPAGLGPRLDTALSQLDPQRLAQIATDHGLPAVADPATVSAHVLDNLERILDGLGDDARSALSTLSHGPPTGRVENARRTVTTATARTPIDMLLALGLIVPTEESTVVLPREIGLHLRGGVLRKDITVGVPVPPTSAADPATVDRTAAAGALAAVQRVQTLLDAWGEDPPSVLRTGGLGVRDLRALPSLLDTDEAGCALIAEVALAAGLLIASGDVEPRGTAAHTTGDDGRTGNRVTRGTAAYDIGNSGRVSDRSSRWLPTPEYDAWLAETPAQRWVALATAWLNGSRAAGLAGTRDERERLIPPLGHHLERPLAPEVRRLTLDVLAGIPAGNVAGPDDVLEAVRWRRPRRGGTLRDDLVRWTLREAEALGITGHGALASYAPAMLNGNAQDAAAAVADLLPKPVDHVLVQADLTAVAPGPLRADLARSLAAMTETESRGGASVHRFTAASVRRALESGWTTAEIHEFIAMVSRTPVPQPLSYLVDDVARTYGRLRVGAAASFVRSDDPAVLAEIQAHPSAVSLGARRIAPTVLASDLDPETLLERLARMGFDPVAEGADGTVMITRSEPLRAADRPASGPVRITRPAADESVVAAAVRAIRAGDRSAASRPDAETPAQLGRSASREIMSELRRALANGATLWIGYVDNHGATSERMIDPVRLEGGWLAAFDHRSGEVRSFAVHRISGIHTPAT